VLRAEIEGYLDGLSIVAVLPPRAPRAEPERLEIKTSGADQPLVTSTLAPKRSGERGRRNDRGREGREGREGGGGRRDRDRRGGPGRDRQESRHERPSRPAPPPVEEKPKPKRLRPGKTHRSALLEAVPAEQRPIAEQLLVGGIPAVRQAIDKQNEELKAAGKSEVKPDALLKVAEDLRPRALAAVWRDRAEAAAAVVDDLDLRDLRSVVNAAGDAGRDDESRALAAQLREALANRVEKEHAAWLAELAETVTAGRVVRALRLSSRPPKAGAPIPGDVAIQLAEATAASLTDETGPDRWATVLDALAYSPVRRRVVPQSLPAKLTPDLRATIARLASRLPEIAHIFDIEPDPAAERAARGPARRRPGGRKGDERKGGDGKGDRKRGERGGRKGDEAKGDRKPGGGEAKRDRKPGDRQGGDERKDAEQPKGEQAKDEQAKDDQPRQADESTEPAAPTSETSAGESAATEAVAPETPEAKTVETEAPEAETPEVETKTVETKTVETEAPEAKTPEAEASEAKTVETAGGGGTETTAEAPATNGTGGAAEPADPQASSSADS
jgi:hypothetical protein